MDDDLCIIQQPRQGVVAWIRPARLVVLLVSFLAGCGGGQRSEPSPGATTADIPPLQGASSAPLSGQHTFIILPARSKASYYANEEFFPGALRRLGIQAGKFSVVGSTQAIEGRFVLDPDRPGILLGENAFTVRVDTLTSNEQRRDDYMREIRDDGGPSFDAYPTATFTAKEISGASSHAGGNGRRDLTMKLVGDLTIRDIARRVVFDVMAQLAGNTLTGTASAPLKLSDFAIGPIDFYDTLVVSDDIRAEVQFTARAQ